MGFTAVLHTWGQQVQPHIHLHCMVTGGALVESADGYTWEASKPTFLFPVVELSAAFRKRFCDGLLKRYRTGALRLADRCAEMDFDALVARMRQRQWEVYIQKPPRVTMDAKELSPSDDAEEDNLLSSPAPEAMPQQLLDPMHLAEYLGRYVHQSAIANARLLEIRDGNVHFRYYDNRDKDENGRGIQKEMSLPGVEFIRRILWHVLPKGYVRIRHYGLHASGCRIRLQIARLVLGLPLDLPPKPQLDLADWLQSLGHENPNRCPFCQTGTMRQQHTFGPLGSWRLRLLIFLGVAVRGHVLPEETPP
jgi:hypothetical protein